MIINYTDVSRAYRQLALPSVAMWLADEVVAIVDTIAMGFLGVSNLAAVTVGGVAAVAAAQILLGLSAGVGILGARKVGEGDMKHFGLVVRSAGFAPIMAALALAIIGSVAAPSIVAATGLTARSPAAAEYMSLRFIALVFVAVAMVIISAFEAAGDGSLGLRAFIITNIVHVPLVIMLGVGTRSVHGLGPLGAGISTLCAEAAAAVFCVVCAIRRSEYRIFESPKLDKVIIGSSLAIGYPDMLLRIAMSIPDVAIIRIIAPLGVVAISGYRVMNLVANVGDAAVVPFANATQIVIGQRLGADDAVGAKAFRRASMKWILRLTVIAAACLAALSWPIAFVVSLSSVVASAVAAPIAFQALSLPLKAIALVPTASLRAAGDTKRAALLSAISGFAILPLAFALIKAGLGLYGVAFAYLLSWILRITFTDLYSKGAEQDNR